MSKSWTCACIVTWPVPRIHWTEAISVSKRLSFLFLFFSSFHLNHFTSNRSLLIFFHCYSTFSSLSSSFPSPSFSLSNLSHVEWIIRINEWGNWIFGVVIIRGLDPYWSLMTEWVLDLWVWLVVACGFMVVWAEWRGRKVYLSFIEIFY